MNHEEAIDRALGRDLREDFEAAVLHVERELMDMEGLAFGMAANGTALPLKDCGEALKKILDRVQCLDQTLSVCCRVSGAAE